MANHQSEATATHQNNQMHKFSFTLLTYNILAQSLFNRREGFSYCNHKAALWTVRRENLLNEIEFYNSDIICLQEVDKYEEFWKDKLKELGYSSFYHAQYNPSKNFREMPYGLAFAFKSEKFELVESEVILMEQELLSNSQHLNISTDESVLEKEEIKHSGNIAQIFVLKSKESEDGLLITNSHLFWRPECNYVRLRQLMLLIAHTLSVNHRYSNYPVLSVGDFNTTPNSIIYKLLHLPGRTLTKDKKIDLTNQLSIDGIDIEDITLEDLERYFNHVTFCEEKFIQDLKDSNTPEEQIFEQLEMEKKKRMKSIKELISHFVKNYPSFRSMYSWYGKLNPQDHEEMRVHFDWDHNEVLYTMYTPDFKSTLDYIFVWNTQQHSKIELKRLLSIPLPKDIDETCLPSEKHSSDHFSLMVDCEIVHE
ncbi:predicted protein [Naegleria gruberi]|uniref:Predicted protein n=1 Tax=Naegleria gruberi TaxID=5762 RepID=D2VFD3_NAEGR|nr:uncharacterized protein NAEGRDRAFT_49087 [Naegleria gruberi]EFC44439.1 predicted protein [Naegleria gruberi]|eukprot:XP_002677183.1 predicted protein [Naegleria gruberi strain NEG-M]